MFLHNICPTIISWAVFLIKPGVGLLAFYTFRKIRKDKFDPKNKIPSFLKNLFKDSHMELINLLNSSYMLIGVFTFLQYYDITNLDW